MSLLSPIEARRPLWSGDPNRVKTFRRSNVSTFRQLRRSPAKSFASFTASKSLRFMRLQPYLHNGNLATFLSSITYAPFSSRRRVYPLWSAGATFSSRFGPRSSLRRPRPGRDVQTFGRSDIQTFCHIRHLSRRRASGVLLDPAGRFPKISMGHFSVVSDCVGGCDG